MSRDVFFCGCFDYCCGLAGVKKCDEDFSFRLVEADEYALDACMRGGMRRGDKIGDDAVDGVGMDVARDVGQLWWVVR